MFEHIAGIWSISLLLAFVEPAVCNEVYFSFSFQRQNIYIDTLYTVCASILV